MDEFIIQRDPCGRATKGETERWMRHHLCIHVDACVIWPFNRTKHGYPTVIRGQKCRSAAAVLCEMTHGPKPSADHESAHSCGNGAGGCMNWSHLRWATHLENEADKAQHGTRPRGERQGGAILTSEKVTAIYLAKGIEAPRVVAAKHGVVTSTVHAIYRRRNWGWLTSALESPV